MKAVGHKVTLQALQKDAAAGTHKAFERVYQENRTMFINTMRSKRYGLSDEEILDVYQDAYVALFENIMNGKLTELRSSISTYLISIGRNMALNRLRKQNRKRVFEQSLRKSTTVDEHLDSFDIVVQELNPEQRQLRKNFKELGKKCQEILTLFYFKLMSIQDIIEHTAYKNPNVVKSQKSRCLRQLKGLMKIEGYDG